MTWGERGLVPDYLGWLRVVRGPKKALGCKLWVAIGLPLLRFPWAWGLPYSPPPTGGGFRLEVPWVRLVVLEGRPWVLNLTPYHETAARLLGAQRYYLLE